MTANRIPPCEAGCPVRTEAGRYVRLIAEGDYEEAHRVICRTNPFPSVCAYVCQRPCEKGCRRAQIDAPVAIRALKRFVVQRVGGRLSPPPPPPESGHRIAVIGAGPAGLAAAHDLRMRGVRVSVFERLDRPGGMLNVIPRYRLPREALEADLRTILSSGIEFVPNTEIGRDASVAELLERGFEAVIVATGLSRSRGIAVPGFGAQRFTAAIPWMTDIWLGNRVDVGRRVVVIGGGNVAADVARTARRLGAERVALVCLESREEIPAEPEEIALAEAEGIEIMTRRALKRVLNREGKIAAVELMSVVSLFDSEGRFRPIYDASRVQTLAADMVVLSIGQGPDRSWARGTSIRLDARGHVVADRETHSTSLPRVFLAGESLRGPGSAIRAVADGQRAADVVVRFLETGRATPPPADDASPLEPFPADVLSNLRRISPVAEGAQPFAPSEPTIDEACALREAGRCLGCLAGAAIDASRCASCLTCFRICPLDAIEIGDPMRAEPARCQACGLCASVCPANAIDLAFWRGPRLEPRPSPPSADGEATLAMVCSHRDGGGIRAARTVRIPCLARLKPADLLRAFAGGYRAISLHACPRQQCKYAGAWENIESVVGCARDLLRAVRPEARIELDAPPSDGEGSG